jgi:hypothetical protein
MEIRRFEVKDADALWRLRMTALETDPWSFAESVEELQQISVEEYGRRIGSGSDGNFVMGAFEGARAIETARTLPDLKSIQLTVSITQDAARQLYRRLGFRVFGVEPRALGIGGEFLDEEHMILELDAR